MVLLFGTSTKQKKLDFIQSIFCSTCKGYEKYEAFITYSIFTLFFIPLFKWNKKYYITCVTCGSLYRLNKDIGVEIERGRNVNITESDLKPININTRILCSNCKAPLEDDFEYCPKCGEKV